MLVKTFLYGKGSASLRRLTGLLPKHALFDVSIRGGAGFGEPYVASKRLLNEFSDYQVQIIDIRANIVSIELFK